MSSAPPVEHFKGTGWEECDDFILAIRKRAFWEGKQRDSAWIADFAATHFSRHALWWHSRLPLDVRQDWFQLEVALLDRWPPPRDDNEPQIKPTPAAAPSLGRNDRPHPQVQGFLKVVLDGSNTTSYIKLRTDGHCDLTTAKNEAIQIRCSSLPSGTLLERVDHPCHSWLAIHWGTSPNLARGSTQFALMSFVDSTLKSSWYSSGPFQLISCTVSANGEVIPVWKKDNTDQITIVPFVGGSGLYLPADPEAYAGHYKSEKRAKFFIEATN